MKLSDLFKDLAVGDLRNLSMAENKTIREADHETVVLFINEGLTNIHSGFDVNLRDVLIETHKHITFYHLLKRFAESQVMLYPLNPISILRSQSRSFLRRRDQGEGCLWFQRSASAPERWNPR